MIKAAREELSLDRVLIIPTALPPHKQAQELVSGEHRTQMCQLAMAGEDWAQVSDIEIRRGGSSYTVDTLIEIKADRPDTELFLVVGGDMLLSFEDWWRWEEILEMATLCAAPRADGQKAELVAKAGEFSNIGQGCMIMSTPVVEISSTEIRQQLKGEGIPTLLPVAVAEYCREHGLYTRSE